MKTFKKIPKKYVFEQNYSNMVMEDFEKFSMDFLNENQETYLNENSLGQKIVPDDDPIKLQNFWKWFGNSKCVDEKGRPLVVYHGTQHNIESFNNDRKYSYSQGIGFYFTCDENVAKSYIPKRYVRSKKKGSYIDNFDTTVSINRDTIEDTDYYTSYDVIGNIYNVYLKMKNPFVFDYQGKRYDDVVFYNHKQFGKNTGYTDTKISSSTDFVKYANENGYDGVILKNILDAGSSEGHIISNTLVVFEPNQIKSINNKGTFSSSSDNIFESENQAVSTLPNENSLGEKIIPDDDPVKLQNFWKWFQRSKIVSRNGKPLVVYHGSNETFTTFDKERVKEKGSYWSDGFYFTTYNKPEEKNEYNRGASRYGKNIYAVYLSIKNPFIIKNYKDGQRLEELLGVDSGLNKTDKFGDSWAKFVLGYRSELTQEEIREKLIKAGYDGIINAALYSTEEVYIIAFDSNQIKSVNNKGTFSSSSDNIFEVLNLEEFPNRQKITVYHGSSNKNLKIKDDSLIYFTTNKEDAIRWADRFILGGKKNKNSYIYTAEITFDKPYVIGDTSVNSEYKKYEDQPEKEKKEIFSEIFYDDLNENRSELISKGYDCFIDNQISDNITYYIVPSQFMDNIKWLKIEDKESLNESMLLNEMKMEEAGIQLATTELWKALQIILKKATGNKTSKKKYVIPTKTNIFVKMNDETSYFPICVLTGDFDTMNMETLKAEVKTGLRHFSSHFKNINVLSNKNYRPEYQIDKNGNKYKLETTKTPFETFILACKELNKLLHEPFENHLGNDIKPIYKNRKLDRYEITLPINYNNNSMIFKIIIRLPYDKNEIAFIHTMYRDKRAEKKLKFKNKNKL